MWEAIVSKTRGRKICIACSTTGREAALVVCSTAPGLGGCHYVSPWVGGADRAAAPPGAPGQAFASRVSGLCVGFAWAWCLSQRTRAHREPCTSMSFEAESFAIMFFWVEYLSLSVAGGCRIRIFGDFSLCRGAAENQCWSSCNSVPGRF